MMIANGLSNQHRLLIRHLARWHDSHPASDSPADADESDRHRGLQRQSSNRMAAVVGVAAHLPNLLNEERGEHDERKEHQAGGPDITQHEWH